ncbi:hypothetical protein [Tahibacter amnicola]|uniref:Uncharacterized protein n=1 Tax=Tahibacter amnicola TaxID=2976241 RepID=A0ABY6BA31_9GAMM|nr:hypothetical protein [Tahibacter amnicola]UXI66921.1 hypothetical protein N4264_19505 [Tahibacter amnicola]
MAAAIPSLASAAGGPTFEPLGRPADAALHADASPIHKPQNKILPAPRVSEVRLVPGPDGQLRQVCRDIPNPALNKNKAANADGAAQ